MGEVTSISWTNHTFNPWHGCTKVSPGCDHCYAEGQDVRYQPVSHWGKGVPRKTMSDAYWKDPIRWQKNALNGNRIDKVFCGSMCDVMDDESPVGQRERLWEVIDKTPNLLWQLLTKRPQRYQKYLPADGFAHDNVILGATTEDQEFYNIRIRYLYAGQQDLEVRNSLHRGRSNRIKTFISYEPALGALSILPYPGLRPDWVIFGGETGEGRRPMEQKWAEDIKAECEELGVAFFMKQMSAFRPTTAASLIPAHLLLRQFPA